MKISGILQKGSKTPFLCFVCNKDERDYLFKNAERITNRISFTYKNGLLLVHRAELDEENSMALNQHGKPEHPVYSFQIYSKYYSLWDLPKFEKFTSQEIQYDKLVVNGIPHFQIKFQEFFATDKHKLQKRIWTPRSSEPLYRPHEHPPGEVKVTIPEKNIKEGMSFGPPISTYKHENLHISPENLKSFMEACQKMAKSLNAELFIDETGALRARIYTVL